MREGIWRLYRLYSGEDGDVQRRLVARFVLRGQRLTELEDHDGLLERVAPGGDVTARVLARLKVMAASPYWRLVDEDAVRTGEHEDLLPEVQE